MTEQVTDVNQLSTTDGRLYEHEDCGLCCSLSEALDAGLPRDETIASMEQWYANVAKDSPVDGTGCEANAAWLRQEGLDAVAFTGGMDVVDGFLANGWRVTLAIWSNSAGYPYSGAVRVGHFIELCYPNGDGSYTVMQPVGGYTTSYSRDLLVANSQNCGIVVHHDYRQSAVTTVVGTSSGGVPMSFDPNLTRRALNDVVHFLGGGNPTSDADLNWEDTHAASLGAGEEEWFIEGVIGGTDTAENPQIHRGLTILHTLAQGQIPPELVPAIKALVGGGS